MVVRECLNCGKEFKVHNYRIKRGGGKFCSNSCSTSYRNKIDNPAKRPEVRKKISENHANFSGKNNPMYGKKGALCPSYIDGRSYFKSETYRNIAFTNFEHKCACCGESDISKLEVHHKDGNHRNNDINNLIILCKYCHLNKAHTYLRDSNGRFVGAFLNSNFYNEAEVV